MAHLTDIAPVEELAVSIAVQTPGGIVSTPTRIDSLAIGMRGPYLLATLRALALMEERGHGFVPGSEVNLRQRYEFRSSRPSRRRRLTCIDFR